jgi:hypothetical protein
MQLLTLERSQSAKLFWLIVALLGVVMIWTAKQTDPGIVATAMALGLVAAFPFHLWLSGASHGLPIWPVFALINGATAALPMIQDPVTLESYQPSEIIIGGLTMMFFIGLGTLTWLAITARRSQAPRDILMISRQHADRYLFAFIVAGLFFQLNQIGYWIALPGNSMQVVRGVTMSLNTMGIFVLAFYAGRKMLTKPQEVALVALAAATALVMASGLIMASAIVPVAMLLLGYALGSGTMPWKGLGVVFLAAALLHPGKYAMRELYWGPESPQFTVWTLPQFYAEWFGQGVEGVGALAGGTSQKREDAESSTIFERAGNLHMLLLVQQKSPDQVPFLNGLTYEPIPRLLIPRFLDRDKGISHAGNVLLTVNYGVQTLEQTATTSIAWGLVSEAYANFGYIGVVLLAVFLGIFYGFFTNLSVGVPMTSLRFVLGLLILGAATKADTMGVFLTQQFQGIVGVSLAALVLMKRQSNPFAAEGGREGMRHTAEGSESKRQPSLRDGLPSNQLTRDEKSKRLGGDAPLHAVTPAGQVTGDGGMVRTLPIRTPKRIASWMPRRVRAAVVAQYAAQEIGGEEGEVKGPRDQESKRPKDGSERPRQVAVPYQNYRRYRG